MGLKSITLRNAPQNNNPDDPNYFRFGNIPRINYSKNPLWNVAAFIGNVFVNFNNDANDITNNIIVPAQRLANGGVEEFLEAEAQGAKTMGESIASSVKYTVTTPVAQQIEDAKNVLSTSAYWERTTSTVVEALAITKVTDAVIPQTSAKPPPVETTNEARYVYDAATRNYRDLKTGHFIKQQDLPYPANSGFESWSNETLQLETTIDRYGKTSGRYAGEPGATISQRGMPPGSENLPYQQFEVIKPIENVKVGPAASVPDFMAEGGAKQYYLPKSINDLIGEYLRVKK